MWLTSPKIPNLSSLCNKWSQKLTFDSPSTRWSAQSVLLCRPRGMVQELEPFSPPLLSATGSSASRCPRRKSVSLSLSEWEESFHHGLLNRREEVKGPFPDLSLPPCTVPPTGSTVRHGWEMTRFFPRHSIGLRALTAFHCQRDCTAWWHMFAV